MTSDEKNRKIAEWLGWTQIQWIGGPVNDWRGVRPEDCKLETQSPIPDYYTSEEANAALLDKLLATGKIRGRFVQFGFSFDFHYGDNYGYDSLAWANDRKTAVCEAALKLFEFKAG